MMQNAASHQAALNGDAAHSDDATIAQSTTTDLLNSLESQNGEPTKATHEEDGDRDQGSEQVTHSTKKRKFDELQSRSRSTSRAVSPPWKSFAADGPTQFTADGKRRSGRVNNVPLELQPPNDKRQTRRAHDQSLVHREPKRSSRLKEEHKPPITKSPTVKNERRISAVGKAALNGTGPSSATPRSLRSEVKSDGGSKNFVDAQTPSKASGLQIKDEPGKDAPTTPPKRRPGRPSNAARLAQANSLEAQADVPTDADQMNTRRSQTSPKLKLRLPRQNHSPRHPDYIPKPTKFQSLEELLSHYDQKEEEQGPGDKDDEPTGALERKRVERIKRTPEELAYEEARIRVRLLDAAKPGGALSEQKAYIYLPDDQQEPPTHYNHVNHLWAHGAYFRLLMEREKARHMEMAKRTAHACLLKWKERQPQTEEEKQKEENEFFKLIYRQTVRDVKLKWDMITGEIERRRLAQWIEEQELTRDRKMQKMLESATGMLERRRLGIEEADSSIMDESEMQQDSDDDQSSVASNDHARGLGADTDDDDNMTSSESEDEAEGSLKDADNDDDLSPEELKAKYANLPAQDIAQANLDDSEVEGGGSDISMADAQSDADDNDEIQEGPTVNTGIDISTVALEEVDDELLDDEDDESTDMSDDDMTTSDDEDNDDSGADADESEEEEESMGLMGFLGGRERKLVQADSTDRTPEVEANMAGSTVDTKVEATVDRDDSVYDTVMLQEPSTEGNHLSVTSHEGDHSSQPTPLDDSTAVPSDAESTTSVDMEDAKSRIMPTLEETQGSPQITTKVPSLLRGTLREYQHYGLDWLAKLYVNQTNGILADEMGLGKTIQTISLLAHLAEEHEVWGPHLIVVPTSVILNWEMEFKKFLPGFKVLSYYGTVEERKEKRKGWSNPDNYNVVITSYQLVLKDLNSIRNPEWHYMILDEAHNIKNFQSQRYQAMIRLKTHARLLLTGTPLQNSIQELWSLLTFLTAGQDGQGMGDLDEFTQWFKRPVDEIFVDGKNKLGVEAQEIVNKLHHSLRPYILRRMKAQVEKQLPGKYEHTIFCRLSKRQRQLYDSFLARSDVKEKLSSGNPISVSQALMALRKVCNHPDLFEERPIVTSFTMRKPWSKMPRSIAADFEIKDLFVRKQLADKEADDASWLIEQNFNIQALETKSTYQSRRTRQLAIHNLLQRHLHHQAGRLPPKGSISGASFQETLVAQHRFSEDARLDKLSRYITLTDARAGRTPMYGCDLVERCTVMTKDRLPLPVPRRVLNPREYALGFADLDILPGLVQSLDARGQDIRPDVRRFGFVTPNAVANDLLPYAMPQKAIEAIRTMNNTSEPDAFHESRVRLSIAFPDTRLLQYDCGKLQQLAILLRNLQDRGSRALIFTQMTSVLDILERFLNIHGYRYMRLDGSTRIEQRQDMMERFNRDTRIDVFILSSRSGGVGMNLTGADTVIFYDLDWNPQMDKQCQDRAHRIGQTRDVHIYKLVSEHTIEVNILKKSNQKRMLDEVVIQEGEFTTDWFNKAQEEEDDYVADDEAGAAVDRVLGLERKVDVTKVLASAEDDVDVQAAQAQQREAHMDAADFNFDSRQRSRSNTVGPGTPAAIENPHDIIDSIGMDLDEEVGLEDIPHVDDYMLGLVQYMLRDVAFVPPIDKSKRGRLDKNGRDRSHRPKKI